MTHTVQNETGSQEPHQNVTVLQGPDFLSPCSTLAILALWCLPAFSLCPSILEDKFSTLRHHHTVSAAPNFERRSLET